MIFPSETYFWDADNLQFRNTSSHNQSTQTTHQHINASTQCHQLINNIIFSTATQHNTLTHQHINTNIFPPLGVYKALRWKPKFDTFQSSASREMLFQKSIAKIEARKRTFQISWGQGKVWEIMPIIWKSGRNGQNVKAKVKNKMSSVMMDIETRPFWNWIMWDQIIRLKTCHRFVLSNLCTICRGWSRSTFRFVLFFSIAGSNCFVRWPKCCLQQRRWLSTCCWLGGFDVLKTLSRYVLMFGFHLLCHADKAIFWATWPRPVLHFVIFRIGIFLTFLLQYCTTNAVCHPHFALAFFSFHVIVCRGVRRTRHVRLLTQSVINSSDMHFLTWSLWSQLLTIQLFPLS